LAAQSLALQSFSKKTELAGLYLFIGGLLPGIFFAIALATLIKVVIKARRQQEQTATRRCNPRSTHPCKTGFSLGRSSSINCIVSLAPSRLKPFLR
jgi:hypothetical protein